MKSLLLVSLKRPPEDFMLARIVKVLSVLALLVLVAAATLMLVGTRNLGAGFDVPEEVVRVPQDPESLAEGERLVGVYGCRDCHGPDLSGTNFIEGGAFMDLPAPNLTPAGIGAELDALAWERAIRHGVGYDGRPLVIMPSEAYQGMSDQDLGAVVAYLQSLPPRPAELIERRIGPVGRVVSAVQPEGLLMGRLVDHEAPHPASVERGETAAYGSYLAALCMGCHGPELSGGIVPGTQGVTAPSLRPAPGAFGDWTRDDFFRSLREGVRRNGQPLSEDMPWRAFSGMNDTEIGALWLYLRSLDPVEAAADA